MGIPHAICTALPRLFHTKYLVQPETEAYYHSLFNDSVRLWSSLPNSLVTSPSVLFLKLVLNKNKTNKQQKVHILWQILPPGINWKLMQGHSYLVYLLLCIFVFISNVHLMLNSSNSTSETSIQNICVDHSNCILLFRKPVKQLILLRLNFW